MFCEVVKHLTIYENADAGAWFPGIVRLPSGELYATFSTGDDFEGRMTMAAARSADDGASWRSAGAMFDGFDLGLGNLKPTLLADGTLICLGYGFSFGDDGLVNSATGGLAPGGNYVAFSRDGGRSWSTPQRFDTGHPEVLETSGPCVELRNGDLLAVRIALPSAEESAQHFGTGRRIRLSAFAGKLDAIERNAVSAEGKSKSVQQR